MGFGEKIKKGIVGTKKFFGDVQEALKEQEEKALDNKKAEIERLKAINKKNAEKDKLESAIKKEKAKMKKSNDFGNDLFRL